MFWVFFSSVSTLWMNRFCLIAMSWFVFLNPEKCLEYLKEPSEMFANPKPKTNKAKIHYNLRYGIWDLFLILWSCSREVHCTRMLYLIPKISQPFPFTESAVVNSAMKEIQWNSSFHLLSPEWKKEETFFFLILYTQKRTLHEVLLYPRL